MEVSLSDQIKLLIVDDEPGLLEQAEFFLKKENDSLDIETSTSAQEGLEMIESGDFDAVISDYQMPQIDGLEFLKRLRERGNDIPFIMFTGKGREEVAIEALNLGADRYLQKGGNPKSQYRVLSNAVAQEVRHWKGDKKLEKSEKRYKTIFETTGAATVILEEDMTISLANEEFEELSGYSKEEIEGKLNLEEFIVEEDLEKIRTGHETQKRENEDSSKEYEFQFIDREGNIRDGLISISNIPGTSKNVGSILDITGRKKMEEKLRKSEKKFRDLFELSPDPVCLVDEEGVFKEVNETFCEISGFDRDNIIGYSFSDSPFIPQEDKEKLANNLERRLNGEHVPPYTIEFETREGEKRYAEINSKPVREGGEITGLIVIPRDITEKKRAKERAKQERERFERLFEEANEMIITTDKEGNITRLNKRVEEMSGYSREELKGESILKLAHPEDREKYIEFWKEILNKEEPKYELRAVTKDGKTGYLSVGGTPIEKNGEIVEIQYNARDITERKEAEKELSESEKRFRKLFELGPDGAIIVNPEGVIEEVNETLCQKMGYEREEIVGKSLFEPIEFLPQESQDKIIETLEEKYPKEEIAPPFTIKGFSKSGETIYAEINADFIRENGEIVGILGILRDVTDREKTKRELKESKEEFESYFEANPDPVYMHDSEGVFKEVNQAFCDVSGYEREEIIGTSVMEAEFLTEEGKKKSTKNFKKMLEEGEISPYTLQVETKDGKTRWVEINAENLEKDGEIAGVIGIARDITERKKAEEELSESEKKYRETIEEANVGVVVYGSEGDMKILNPEIEEITGYKKEEMPTIEDWFKKLYPNEKKRKKIKDEWFRRISDQGYVSEGEATITTKGGETRNLLFQGVLQDSGDVLCFVQDITERKRAQERQEFLHSLLRHDLRNKISIIEGYHDLLLDSDLSEEQEEFVKKAIKNARDSSELIEKVRTLRKIGEEETEETEIDPMIKNAISKNETLASDRGMEIEYESRKFSVKADPLLEELFSNLIENSIQHSEGSTIKIRAEEENGTILITVEDDGKGISDDIKRKIFQRGFKKGENAGSGLGMYLCKKIVESYDGQIGVEDSELGGAKFTMKLNKT